MSAPDFAMVEQLAAELCVRSGGHWLKAGTKKNLWRRRAIALWHLSRGEEAEARKIMAKRP